MRPAFLLRFFGRLHAVTALLLLVPLGVSLLHDESAIGPWLAPALLCAAIAGACALFVRSGSAEASAAGLRRREGFLVVAGSWILMVIYGAVPFVWSGYLPDFASAVFESMSGFTTTGATVLWTDPATRPEGHYLIEELPASLLFWRSFSHWVGGMGIIVLTVAILPELAIGGMQLFAAESSGLGVDKLAPRIAQTAKRLWVLYVSLTALEVVLLLPSMSWFDAVNHAFATLATGGFSTKNGSVADFQSPYVETVITIFMLIAGMNFAILYRFLRGERHALWSEEIRCYFIVGAIFTAVIAWDVHGAGIYPSFLESFRYASFQAASIITTTGFGTADFNLWPTLSLVLLTVLMASGACAGSTAGGVKMIRVVVVLKHAGRECLRLIHPRMVRPITIDRSAIGDDILFSILGYLFLYALVLVIATIVLAVLPHERPMDLVTASTAALSALNSIGPGLGAVGPAENFSWIHPIGKVVLSFCMLLGRLEIYTLLVLFLPRFWSRR